MSMLSTDPILAAPRGSASRAIAFLSHPDDTDHELVRGLYRWGKAAGVDAAIAVAQAFLETGDLTSIRWIRDRNSANIGVTSPVTPQPFEIPDGDAAARLQIQCLHALANAELHPDVPLWPAAEQWLRAHLLEETHDPGFPAVQSIADLNRRYRDRNGAMKATWASDDAYHARLIAKGNAIFGNIPDGKETSVPALASLQPTIEIALTPVGNQNRPLLEMVSPSFITVHEIGDETTGSDEFRLRNAVHAGGGPEQRSYHFVVGPCRIIQLLPLDEVAWHANDGYFGTGNRDSVAIAMVRSGDTGRARAHLAWLLAELISNAGRFISNQPRAWDFSAERIRRCRARTSGRGAEDRQFDWAEVMRRLDEYIGPQREPGARPQPVIPEFMNDEELARGIDRRLGASTAYALRRLWYAVRDTPRLQHASPDAPELGQPIRKGESFIGEFVYKCNDQWWVLTRWGARICMDDLAPQIELCSA